MISNLIEIYSLILKGSTDSITMDQKIPKKIRQLIKIELMITDEQINEAQDLLSERDDDFITDIVLMRSYLLSNSIEQAQSIQIKWQNVLDKFKRDPLIDLYLGLFYLYQGVLYHSLDEYEVAANQFSKSEKYFKSIDFNFGLYVIHDNIAICFEDLGAYGDARYHFREKLNCGYDLTHYELFYHYLNLAKLYQLDNKPKWELDQLKKAESIVDKLDLEDKLVLYNQMYLHFKDKNVEKMKQYLKLGRDIIQQISD